MNLNEHIVTKHNKKVLEKQKNIKKVEEVNPTLEKSLVVKKDILTQSISSDVENLKEFLDMKAELEKEISRLSIQIKSNREKLDDVENKLEHLKKEPEPKTTIIWYGQEVAHFNSKEITLIFPTEKRKSAIEKMNNLANMYKLGYRVFRTGVNTTKEKTYIEYYGKKSQVTEQTLVLAR